MKLKLNLLGLLLLIYGASPSAEVSAQLGTAPDFTVTDIDGNTHSLYEDILDQGLIAVVEVSATWCPPCWSFHGSQALELLNQSFGPQGTNQLRVILYEGDASTTMDDIQGSGNNTQGDWTEGISFPIVNESPLSLDLNVWAPVGFPTVNVIRPSDYEIVLDTWNILSFEGQAEAINNADIDGIVLGLQLDGCTDSDACNFNPAATEDDGSCDYSCFGCTDPEAVNWNATATVDDGSCTYFETSCEFIGSEGWADLGAGLFAEVEVLTHEFGVVGDGALVLSLPEVMEEPATGNAFAVMAWNDLTLSGLPNGFTLSNAPTSMDPGTQVCLTYSGTPVEEGMFDVLVSGELVLSVFGQPYPVGPYSSMVPMLITPNVSGIVGCTYPNATNYLSYATIESGTCTFEGCMDPEANNFQIFALSDDGSCDYDACASTCPSDVDGDGSVGTGDLLSMLASFGLVCE